MRASDEEIIMSTSGARPLTWIFDFRNVMGDAEFLHAYANDFWDTYDAEYPFQVCGMETAGYPLVTAIVMKGKERGKSVSGLYLRKSRKKYGLMRALEGAQANTPVIVVDDLVNTGQSLEKMLSVLADAHLTVSHLFTILTLRDFAKIPLQISENVKRTSLFTSDEFGIPLLSSPRVVQPSTMLSCEWKFSAPNPGLHHVVPKATPAISHNVVYYGTDNGTLYALDLFTGKPLWHYRVGLIPFRKGIFSSPAVDASCVYFGAYDGNFYALNALTGEKKWVYRDADWIGSSPSLAPDLGLLFIGLEFGLFKKQGGIAALSLETGKEVWSMKEMVEYTHSSPLYIKEERCVVIGSNDGTIYCFDATRGTQRWVFKTGGSVKASFIYDRKRRLLCFGSFDATCYAIDMRSGKVQWTHHTEEAIFSTPCIHADIVYFSSLDKSLYALSLDSGEELWRFPTRGRIFASPRIALNTLWIGSNDGRLYGLDPLTGKTHTSFQISERIVNAIAADETAQKIILPSQANELYCLSVKM